MECFRPLLHIRLRDTGGDDGQEKTNPTHKERHRIARALGKVVTHEIIHALTPDRTHEPQGLMRNSLGRHLPLNP